MKLRKGKKWESRESGSRGERELRIIEENWEERERRKLRKKVFQMIKKKNTNRIS